MPLKLKGATSGDVTVDVPAAAGSNTLILPAKSGNIITSADSKTLTQGMVADGVAGTGPAFSAYRATTQSLSSSTWVKLQLNAENFDTASCFDSVTNYRFTPNVAGYYSLHGICYMQGGGISSTNTAIYKNGSIYVYGSIIAAAGAGGSVASTIIYLNGTTDYAEFYAYATVTSGSVIAGTDGTLLQFSGALVRAA